MTTPRFTPRGSRPPIGSFEPAPKAPARPAAADRTLTYGSATHDNLRNPPPPPPRQRTLTPVGLAGLPQPPRSSARPAPRQRTLMPKRVGSGPADAPSSLQELSVGLRRPPSLHFELPTTGQEPAPRYEPAPSVPLDAAQFERGPRRSSPNMPPRLQFDRTARAGSVDPGAMANDELLELSEDLAQGSPHAAEPPRLAPEPPQRPRRRWPALLAIGVGSLCLLAAGYFVALIQVTLHERSAQFSSQTSAATDPGRVAAPRTTAAAPSVATSKSSANERSGGDQVAAKAAAKASDQITEPAPGEDEVDELAPTEPATNHAASDVAPAAASRSQEHNAQADEPQSRAKHARSARRHAWSRRHVTKPPEPPVPPPVVAVEPAPFVPTPDAVSPASSASEASTTPTPDSQSSAASVPNSQPSAASVPSSQSSAASVPSTTAAPEPVDPNLPEQPNRDDVQAALEVMRPKLAQCAGQRHGTSYANVTVNGNGRVTYSTIEGAFAGSPEGSCMARTLRKAKFPRFSGPKFTVRYPFTL